MVVRLGRMTIGAELQIIIDAFRRIVGRNAALAEIKNIISDNIKKEQQAMSQITDWAAQEQADLTAISTALDTVVAGVAALDQLITNFQNSPGTLSAADQTALDGIQAASKALVAKSQAISVAPPVPPVTP